MRKMWDLVAVAYLKSEKGIETLEWILIGALITGVGFAVYPNTLTGQLTTAVTTIGGLISGAATGAGS